ncbi:hypothetical protein D4L85_16335 [Chryseolinea soli]|uniref:STAS/SEC14 domain-containing protein n=2 Tax=Chryseolinea soli TaxID=2321403 RepID=A0A385SLB2_9BACT|nr:hypothetical protein D4L85_16335 [Chryseolinea soli]
MMPEEFKAHLDFGLEFMKEKVKETGKMMWLSDGTLAGAVDEEGIKWVIEDWTPRAIAAGIKYVGFVITENEWVNLAAEEYRETAKEGMTTGYFKDVESVKKWFREITR